VGQNGRWVDLRRRGQRCVRACAFTPCRSVMPARACVVVLLVCAPRACVLFRMVPPSFAARESRRQALCSLLLLVFLAPRARR